MTLHSKISDLLLQSLWSRWSKNGQTDRQADGRTWLY